MARQIRESGLPVSKAKSATPLLGLSLMTSISTALLFSFPTCIQEDSFQLPLLLQPVTRKDGQ